MNTERVESIVTEYHGNNNASLKALLIDACTISAGSPSITVASRLALQWAKGPAGSLQRTHGQTGHARGLWPCWVRR